ncbi:MAG: hypothetical protein IPL63_15370 [Saprospiraceae bacterium]|nr:hypothetical protein [Saprospiraceae bacterium]
MNTVEECSFRMGWPILNDRFYIGLELYSGSYLFFQRYLLRSVVIIFLLSGSNFPTCFGRFSEYKDVNKNYFQINQHVLNIQNKTTHLLINEAIKDISERKIKEPNNKIYDYLESYTWFFTLFILEQEDQYVKALSKKKKLLQNIQSGDKNSPYYLFCQAEILLQWATIHLKFNDKTKAAYDVYEAYQLLSENKKKFPDFLENNKSLSIIHALAQSLPSWVQKLSGIKGSISLGTQQIESLVKNLHKYPLFKEEILSIYVYILFYTKHEKEKAYQIVKNYKLADPNNPLLIFLSATITHKTGRNDEAIRILESRKKISGQLPFYYLDFLYGKYKLCRLDKDADIHMLQFVHHFEGRHYIKEAYQKLYWYELIFKKDVNKQKLYFEKIKNKGNSLIDEDIQALSETKTPEVDPILLKARLLYDGGYYSTSQNLLINTSSIYFAKKDLEEYNYRIAKNADALNQNALAIVYYKNTISMSTGKKYFACSAALSLGLIYEKDKKYRNAREYLNKCLSLHPEGYSTSLHQKAKTVLARIQNFK